MRNDLEKEIQDYVRPAVESLAGLLVEKNMACLELETGELSLKLTRRPGAPVAAPAAAEGPDETFEVAAADLVDEGGEQHLVPVTSELVGLFRASGTDDGPLVAVGDEVGQGAILCFIESMKLMNEVRAPSSGRVVEILVEEGHPVEYGQALMALLPASEV